MRLHKIFLVIFVVSLSSILSAAPVSGNGKKDTKRIDVKSESRKALRDLSEIRKEERAAKNQKKEERNGNEILIRSTSSNQESMSKQKGTRVGKKSNDDSGRVIIKREGTANRESAKNGNIKR